MIMRLKPALVALLMALAACSAPGDAATTSSGPKASASTPADSTPTPTSTPSAHRGPALLEDGPVPPGRYRYDVLSSCDPGLGCPRKSNPELPDVLVTVPAGWSAANEVHLIEPAPAGTGAPNGAALVMGWTNYWAALNSQPCSSVSHQVPDIEVGPTVDDFVNAVVAHPLLDVTEPKPVRLGGYRGQFFTLVGPSDISDCEEWRPWEPSPYLQGPGNRWDIWVMDVSGVRVLIMAEYYPGTSRTIKAELHDMARSIRFVSGKQ